MTDGDDEQLRLLIQKVARRIRRNRPAADIGDSQLGVLFRLEADGPTGPSRLAEHEHVTPPSMNRTVNSLVTQGLVTRAPDPADARKVTVQLTDQGRALIAETRRLREAWFSQRLAELDADERAALDAAIPVLRRLADA